MLPRQREAIEKKDIHVYKVTICHLFTFIQDIFFFQNSPQIYLICICSNSHFSGQTCQQLRLMSLFETVQLMMHCTFREIYSLWGLIEWFFYCSWPFWSGLIENCASFVLIPYFILGSILVDIIYGIMLYIVIIHANLIHYEPDCSSFFFHYFCLWAQLLIFVFKG